MGGGFNPGMDMRGVPQGFGLELGGYPMAGGFTSGMEMGGHPIGYQPSINQSPYPQDAVGNTPISYTTENYGADQEAPSYEGSSMAQPVSTDVTSPVYGPGGNAPVFTPPYNPTIGQPPFMNPYGMNQGTPFGMPRYQEDESSDL
ncbi:hypothetical protein SAFG77S_13569 [Streptomyces afghaniensis]